MVKRRDYLKTTGLAALAGSSLSGEAEADQSQEEATSEWPMFGYDPARTSNNPTATPPKSDIAIDYLPDTQGESVGTPIVGDDAVFFRSTPGSGDPIVTAWDRRTEEIRWERAVTEIGEISNPVLHEGELYIADNISLSQGLKILVLSTEDGSTVESYSLLEQSRDEGAWRRLPSPLVVDDTIYAALETVVSGPTEGVALVAVARDDGTKLWETRMEEGLVSLDGGIAIADGVVYIATGAGLSAIDADTGAVQWTFSASGPQADIRSPITIANETVLVGDNVRHLFALDAESGSRKWTFDNGAVTGWSAAAATSELLYISDQPGRKDPELYAIRLEDGTVRWSVKDQTVRQWKPAVGGDVLYAGTHYNQLYAFDARDGNQLWKYAEGRGKYWTYPVLVDDTVYVAGSRATGSCGGLYRIES